MRKARIPRSRACLLLCLAMVLVVMSLSMTSCGRSSTGKKSTSGSEKLPPGITESEAGQSSTPSGSQTQTSDQSQSTAQTQQESKTPQASADLYGARFTVVSATRLDSNKSAISSSGREVKGDYLEVELTVQNVSTEHLVDLSEYSFRLESPGIVASSYYNYYGDTGTYGKYVSPHEISATLLNYSDLSAVTYKLKVGELLDKVFLFFDLNPENVGRNPNVTKENTNLVIRKVSGTDYGTEVTIPLAGYLD